MAKAKKQKPQRLAGAEETCISPEQEAIIQWFRTVKFRKNLLGGVDEAAMWKKLEELYALYEAAIRAERTRYNVLLEQQTGSLPLDTAKVDSFAKGSPTRATTTTAASGGNREELLGQRPAGHECFARCGRWEPQPVRWHCEAMTVGLRSAPSKGHSPISNQILLV